MQDGLHGVFPRATGVPAHWRPMHGDFAPWNLRRIFRGPLVLFDFEDAAFAPPEADRTYWKVTSAVLRGDQPSSVLDDESRDYWCNVVAARLARAVDPDLDQRLLAAFTP